MARGGGPKLVVDVGVELKRRLHGRLALEGRTVKSWLTERIENFLGAEQLQLYPAGFAATSPGSGPLVAALGREAASDSRSETISTAQRRPKQPNGRSGRKEGRSTKTSRSGVS
jgi:hypothetical protein